MPKDAILIDVTLTTATQAQYLKRLTVVARDFIDLVKRVQDTMSHNNDGTDWTQIETLYGLKAGDGQKTVTMVSDAESVVRGNAQNNSIKQLGERFV